MRDWTPLERMQNMAVGLTQDEWKDLMEGKMNQKAGFEKAQKQLRELKRLADGGDEAAKLLLAGYDRCDPAVLGIPLPDVE